MGVQTVTCCLQLLQLLQPQLGWPKKTITTVDTKWKAQENVENIKERREFGYYIRDCQCCVSKG